MNEYSRDCFVMKRLRMGWIIINIKAMNTVAKSFMLNIGSVETELILLLRLSLIYAPVFINFIITLFIYFLSSMQFISFLIDLTPPDPAPS